MNITCIFCNNWFTKRVKFSNNRISFYNSTRFYINLRTVTDFNLYRICNSDIQDIINNDYPTRFRSFDFFTISGKNCSSLHDTVIISYQKFIFFFNLIIRKKMNSFHISLTSKQPVAIFSFNFSSFNTLDKSIVP